MTVRVLVIDGSAVARKVLADTLDADAAIEVIGVASSPALAAARMRRCKPDVIALEASMEPIDGLTFLRSYMATNPVPTVLVSADGTGELRAAALCAGALSVVEKPRGWDPAGMENFGRELRDCVRRAAGTRMRRATRSRLPKLPERPEPAVVHRAPRPVLSPAGGPQLIVLGTSTGGAAALTLILPRLPKDAPPMVIVDHMPAGFTKEFADSLNRSCRVTVAEASHGQELKRGHVLVAPGGELHTEVARIRGRLTIQLVDAPPAAGHRPSVNVLFRSVAQVVGASAAAGLLTGMGADGAEGLLALRRAGAFTVAQDRATSVVYGMPKAAVELGAATVELGLDDIPDRLLRGA